MTNNITARRSVILQALLSGPKTWTYLRGVYYGEERAKNVSTTSFANQLARMTSMGLIVKTMEGYAITDSGKRGMGFDCAHIVDKAGCCMLCSTKL